MNRLHCFLALTEKDRLGDWSPEKDFFLRLTFRQPVFDNLCRSHLESQGLTLKMTSAQVGETLVASNNPSQESNHPVKVTSLLGSNHFNLLLFTRLIVKQLLSNDYV